MSGRRRDGEPESAETERAAAEEAARRAEDPLLEVLRHELPVALTALMGWIQVLERHELDAEAAARARRALRRSAQMIEERIVELLDLAMIRAGQLRLRLVPVAPKRAVQAALDAVLDAAEERSVAVETAIAPLEGAMFADPERLQQVVRYLVASAIESTPPGGRVRVRVERRGPRLRIQVSDPGRGASRQALEGRSGRIRLAIARELVALHGGWFRAEPAAGHAASFSVSLPWGREAGTSSRRRGPGRAVGGPG